MLAQYVPPAGRENLVEIGNWNLEWFGKSGYGPTDEALQQKNIYNTLAQADIDIWTFCEMTGIKAFDSMMSKLPLYNYVVAPYFPEQKTAFIYKKDKFRLISSKLIGTNHKDSFSTGRFPYEITLVPLQKTGIDTLFLIAVHLKANTGSDAEKMAAYNSRKRSAEWLRMYLNKVHTKHYCTVLGDWNDDLDESIYNTLPSPFTNLQEANFPFTFVTRKFTVSNTATTTGYDNAIDHQLISDRLMTKYIDDSTFVWKIDKYITDYAASTSDHYPVYSLFRSYNSAIRTHSAGNPLPFPNPANQFLNIPDVYQNMEMTLHTPQGQTVFQGQTGSSGLIDISTVEPGFYILLLRGNGITYYHQLIIQR